jgi:TP901 family phage tail tape measure protein
MGSKRLNATITIGGAVTSGLQSALDTAKGKIGQVGDAVQKLEREQKSLNKQIHAYAGYGTGLQKLVTQHAAVTRELEKQRKIMSAKAGMEAGKKQMGSAAMGLGVVGAIAGAASFPIIQAAKFENAMLGVAKQVDGARDASGNLTHVYDEMKRKIQDLGDQMPMATSAIAEMVTAGARMGIATDELVEFTQTAGMMAEAFELPAGDLADQMGKIRTLFGFKTQAEVRALADSINYLDDNAISKGGEIIGFLQRTGGLAKSVKVTGKEMAALGSTLLSLGDSEEVAGTAVNAIFGRLAGAESGTKKMRHALDQLGLSARDVQRGMQKDSMGTLFKVLEKVKALPKDQQIGILTQLVGREHVKTLSKLSGGVEELRTQLALANSEQAKGSMQREYEARLKTTGAQWEILKNRIERVGITIGSVLLPPLNKAMQAMGPIISDTAKWVKENEGLVMNIGILVGTLVGSYAAFQLFTGGIGLVKFALGALKLALATHPVFLLGAVLAAAAVLIYKNWEPISHFFKGMWIEITELFDAAIGAVVKKIEWVGAKWAAFKASFGFGDDGGNVNVSASQSLQPPAPMPKFQASGAAITNNTQNTIHITQRPGQDSKALAEEVARELERKRAVQRRSQIVDLAGAQ